jgi:hypothetical protein
MRTSTPRGRDRAQKRCAHALLGTLGKIVSVRIGTLPLPRAVVGVDPEIARAFRPELDANDDGRGEGLVVATPVTPEQALAREDALRGSQAWRDACE